MKRLITITFIVVLFFNITSGQKLRVGDHAPSFEAVDVTGKSIKLENYKGQKVFLAFFRYASCPVCNYRIHELNDNYDSINTLGFKIIAIYESSNVTLQTYLSDNPLPFVVIGDPTLELYKKYRVEKSFWKMVTSAFKEQPKEAMKKGNSLFSNKLSRDGNLTRLPADFIIDENGIVKAVHYGTNIADHMPLTEILNK